MLNNQVMDIVENFEMYFADNAAIATFKGTKLLKEKLEANVYLLSVISRGMKEVTFSVCGIILSAEKIAYITKEGYFLEKLFEGKGYRVETNAFRKIKEAIRQKIEINCTLKADELRGYSAYKSGFDKGNHASLSEQCIYDLIRVGTIDVARFSPDYSMELHLTALSIADYLRKPEAFIESLYKCSATNYVLAEKLGYAEGLKALGGRMASISFNQKEKDLFNFYTACKAQSKHIDVILKDTGERFTVKNPIYHKVEHFSGVLSDGKVMIPIDRIGNILSAKKRFGLI